MSDTVVPQIADGEDSTAEPFDEAAEIARLAALSSFDYDRQRDAMAEQLGVRPTRRFVGQHCRSYQQSFAILASLQPPSLCAPGPSRMLRSRSRADIFLENNM
jgi:hypothetical protein